MSELELQLLRFLENGFSSSPRKKKCYENMLSREDWEIFDWVQGREVQREKSREEWWLD